MTKLELIICEAENNGDITPEERVMLIDHLND